MTIREQLKLSDGNEFAVLSRIADSLEISEARAKRAEQREEAKQEEKNKQEQKKYGLKFWILVPIRLVLAVTKIAASGTWGLIKLAWLIGGLFAWLLVYIVTRKG